MTVRLHNSVRMLTAIAGVAAACSTGGCKAREMGVDYADQQAARVDNTWLVAANHCWPDLRHQGFSVDAIQHFMADPLHFRATFGAYAPLSDARLRNIVMHPVAEAPSPDTSVFDHSQTPLLTRADAVTGSNPRGTLVSEGNGLAPDDTLCAIQAGVPVGFR